MKLQGRDRIQSSGIVMQWLVFEMFRPDKEPLFSLIDHVEAFRNYCGPEGILEKKIRHASLR
jgi:hypothetical protein